MEYQTLGEILGFIGINTDIIPEKLPPQDSPSYLRTANNVLIKNGMIEKIRGIDYLNSVTTQLGIANYRRVLGLPIYRKYAGAKYLMAVTPQRLYYLQANTSWTNLGTITDGAEDSVFSFATVDDKFIFTLSDSKFIWYWDGTTYDKLFAHPTDDDLQARFVTEFGGHLFLARTIESTVENYQRLKWSNAHAPTIFSVEDQMDLAIAQAINNIKPLGRELIVYFLNGIIRFYFADDIYGPIADPITAEGIGLYAPKTLCGTKDIHFFLSQEGLMALESGTIPKSISDEKFNHLILDQIDPVYYYRATARFYPHLKHLYLSYPKSGSSMNDVQLIYDLKAGELVSMKNLTADNISAYGEFEKDLSTLSADERKNYGMSFVPIIGTRDGYVYEQQINGYQDKTQSYESSITLPPTFWRSRSKNKRVLQMYLLIEKLTSANITFKVDFANEANENYSYSFTITGSGGTGIRRYDLKSDALGVGLDCLGKEFTVKIKDSANTNGWKFHGAGFLGYWTTDK